MNSNSNDDALSVFIPDDVIEDCLNEWRFSLIGRLDLVKLKMETVETSLRKQWVVKVQQILEVSSNAPSMNNVIQVTKHVIAPSQHRVTQVLSMEEKKGGTNPLTTSMLEFINCIQNYEMIQAPKTGLEFSWCNNRSRKKIIACNLDRAFYNAQWLNFYPSWGYKVGTRGTSYHSPLFGTNATIPKPTNVPFRALKVWMSHKDLKKVIEEAWKTEVRGNPSFIFLTKLKHIKVILKRWNWEVFEDVNQKLKKVNEEVLKQSLISDQSPHNTSLLNKLVNARGAQEILTQHKQEIERQKARVKWLKFGAANTKFFHVNIKIRKMHNEIVELEKDDGELNEDNKKLEAIPSAAEIKQAVFDLDPNSSPGPDGFGGWFYRMAWEILSEDFIKAIQYCWDKEFILAGPVGYFDVSRGLRKGDPLSPILFVIAEDVLSRRLTSLVMQGKLKPMLQRNGVHPTHIMFADDIFLFCNVEKRNLKSLLQILEEYQKASGQEINLSKSKCFVGGTSNARKNQLAEVCGMNLSNFPDKYLGVMLTPVYKWTIKVLKESDKIIRNFLWSGDPSFKKTVALKWEKTCAPLAEGGLDYIDK
ncbi:uncharacterized protein LOC113324961 [Papaver somniferum]|uniref:uncharacterized protein LOC113324961 n=1 Tax=Papaver somniferum TaxID=3469 RepID=UPI000E6F903D|nr:uncharacterized protein LOC113324961 [Papaver somniferum]